MNKQISVFDKQYESLIDTVSVQENGTVIKLEDGRFFKFPNHAAALLNLILDGACNSGSQEEITRLVDDVLLPKGIFCVPGEAKSHVKKQPKLSAHFALLPSWLVMSLTKPFLWLFLLPISTLMVISIFASLGYFINARIELISYEYLMTYSPVELLWILPLSLISSLIHELGHATACRKYSKKVGEIGWGFNFIIPVFFANVSNVYLLNRREKIYVALSGVYLQAVFICLLIALIPWQPVLEKFIVLSLITMVFNLIPFFRNDGFWLLNDALKKENLLVETFQRWKSPNSLQWVHFIYGSCFFIFAGIFVVLMARFAFIRGPEMIASLQHLTFSEFGFDESFRLMLIVSHYIAIAVGLFIACKYLIAFLKKLPTNQLQKV